LAHDPKEKPRCLICFVRRRIEVLGGIAFWFVPAFSFVRELHEGGALNVCPEHHLFVRQLIAQVLASSDALIRRFEEARQFGRAMGKDGPLLL